MMNLNAAPKQFASPDNFEIVDTEMTTIAERRSAKSPAPRRTVGFITAASIVIANIIGTGIFTSLGFQLADIQSGFPLLMLWVIGFGSPVFLSFAVVWLVALFHLKNLRVGSAFQNLSTLVKLVPIVALIVAGFFVHPKQPISFLPAPGDNMSIFGASFAVALVYVMYSYSGWNAAVYITGEIKQPEKNVPR